MSQRLYHFTCAHGAELIGRDRPLIVPQMEHPLLRIKVSWFTTEAIPDREKTGLTRDYVPCDRMEYRYVITDLSHCRPWLGSIWRSAALNHGVPGAIADLETLGDPEHWWVAHRAVLASFEGRNLAGVA